MTKKATKYGIMIMAAVLVIAMAFAGAASADTAEISSDEWNALSNPTSGLYHFTNQGTEKIQPKKIGLSLLTLTGDLILDFTGYTDGFAGNESSIWKTGALFGNVNLDGHNLDIIGLNMTSVNISSSMQNTGGILGFVNSDDTGMLNFTNCHLLNCSINGTDDVGGLVGSAGYMSGVNVVDCTAEHCDIVSSGTYVGGLIGWTSSAPTTINGCEVKNSTVASTNTDHGYVGGLIGYVHSPNIKYCSIENTSVYASNDYVGGLFGYPDSDVGIIHQCAIENCVIASGSGYVGGLFGYADDTVNTLLTCRVENSTITGTNFVGGLVGYSTNSPGMYSNNQVKNSAVNGSMFCSNQNESVGGVDDGGNKLGSVTYYSTAGTSSTLAVSDSDFWKKVYWGGNNTEPITTLGPYGQIGGYGVKSYNPVPPGPAPTFYPIYITNASGTYQLSNETTKVYGDTGYANLTAVSGDIYTLELNNFNVIKEGVSIINADVSNLTINLVGDSNLTGNFTVTNKGLLYSSGNLMITTANGGTLAVDNPGYQGNAILANNDVTINGGTVNVTATGYLGYAIYAYYGNVIINGGTVNATATGTNGYAIKADNDVTISGGTITATADNNAIYADNDVTISGGTVTATSYNDEAIEADDDVIISGGTVTATAYNEDAIYADDGSITITSVGHLIANSTTASFNYEVDRNFAALGDNYEYWVNATDGTEPTVKLTYNQFNASGNWTGASQIKSVYKYVLIKKTAAPTPQYTPSSSSHSGGSVLLQPGQTAPTQAPTVAPTVKPTVKPTAAPTDKPVAPTVAPTATPTAQQTQASPAPIFGLIAGLGAAAVLLRLRK